MTFLTTPLMRSFIGFDSLFDEFDRMSNFSESNYPAYNIIKTDGSGNQFLTVPAGGSRKPASETTVKQRLHYVYQDGKTVFKYAVNKMSEVSNEIIKNLWLYRYRLKQSYSFLISSV